MILSIPGHTNKRTAQSYFLVILTNKRPKNRQGTPRDINENCSQNFLGQKLLDFLSFLRTTSPIETSDNFPEPRPKLRWSSNFRIFSPQHLTSCYPRPNENCWFFNQNYIQQLFFRFKNLVLSAFRNTSKRTAQIHLLVILTNKRPKRGYETPRDFNEKNVSRHFFIGTKYIGCSEFSDKY